MATKRNLPSATTAWALVTGLTVGLATGRTVSQSGRSRSRPIVETVAAAPAVAVAAALPPAAAPVPAPAAPKAPEPPEYVKVDPGDAPAKGPRSAPITIVEYSEFQCPFCSKVQTTLKQVEEAFPGKVRLAFKHLPLAFHQHAQLAAEASLAAHEQGRFWPYHDKLFANQGALERPSLERYAEELKLDLKKFRAALDSGKYREKVQRDAREAAGSGTTGTPTFFVNGRRMVGTQPFEAFKMVIEQELAKPKS